MTNFEKIILTILSISLIPYGCKQATEAPKPADTTEIRIAVVKQEKIDLPVRTSGRLSTPEEIKLSFKTGGVISRIFVKEGAHVEKGQVLARLDLSEINARLDQAGLAVDKARRDYRRAHNLYEDSVATLEQLQNARTALKLAENNLEVAQFNKNYSTIEAPSKGTVLKRLAQENEIIGPGHPVFLFGTRAKNWIVKAGVIDKDIVKINPGDSASLSFDPFPGRSFAGTVDQIAQFADPYTGTYELQIRLDEPDNKLVSGFISRVNIFPAAQRKALTVPVDALSEATGRTGYIFLIKNGKPERRAVSVDRLSDQKLIINSGIAEGDTIITEGYNYIKQNTVIKIVR
ncbi:MAG TPA: efflux RND transporter periplasmic adaptor subunit [Bacteroidales bacterium]|nr:efflux RND transporter periplasmic adaptor subunit [Bacteroidales bacterium]